MSQEQLMGLLRQVLPVIGTLATALGWATVDQVGAWTAVILQIAGPLMILGSSIWSVISNSKAALIKSVAAMPETQVSPSDGTIKINDVALATAAASVPQTQPK